MRETDRIADELARAQVGDPWHGANARDILAGVTAAQAAARPIPGAHTIWELVLHVTGWRREVARRLGGGEPGPPSEGDWPAVPAPPDQEAWARTLAALEAAGAEVRQAVAAFDERRLDEVVGAARDAPTGTGVSYYVMLHGLAQHDAYHLGQISLLKRAQAAG